MPKFEQTIRVMPEQLVEHNWQFRKVSEFDFQTSHRIHQFVYLKLVTRIRAVGSHGRHEFRLRQSQHQARVQQRLQMTL